LTHAVKPTADVTANVTAVAKTPKNIFQSPDFSVKVCTTAYTEFFS
jgi:hypothetical protein